MSPLAISLRFLQTQPDGRLVELARAGHERAFEALVRRYRGPLLAYCRRVAPRGTAAEDILQQGLLQAWKALSGGAEVRDARAWLYRIVHNVAITALRAGGELPDGIVLGPGSTPVDQLVEQRMAARDALAGLAALPDLQRQVMVSTALDGQSHEEIAAAMGLTSGSVRGLIYRARSTLRAAAAAVIPAPVINWALGDAGGGAAGLAGAGSAGLGALVLKGGAVLAVGAVAGTTAIVIDHPSHHVLAAKSAPAVASAADAADQTAAPELGPVSADHGDAAITLAAARGLDANLGASGQAREVRVDGGGRHDGRGDGSRPSGSRGGDGGGGRDGGDGGGGSPGTAGGSPGGTDGSPSGSDGSTLASGGLLSGSDGGDHGATVANSDGGSHVSGGGGSDGGGGGGSGTSTSTSTSSGSSDGGSGGGGSAGGSTTTTTTTTTTDH
jgi:RNA polymerase sigma factor (sigma-70 family)